MSLFEIGRICLKIAGRDANRKCVVVEKVDDLFVIVDGNTRRKKVNVKHLEPLAETVEIKDKATHEEVKKAFEKLGLAVWDKKSKKPAEKPKKQKKIKEKLMKEKKQVKKVEKKETEKKAGSVEKKEKETKRKDSEKKVSKEN